MQSHEAICLVLCIRLNALQKGQTSVRYPSHGTKKNHVPTRFKVSITFLRGDMFVFQIHTSIGSMHGNQFTYICIVELYGKLCKLVDM